MEGHLGEAALKMSADVATGASPASMEGAYRVLINGALAERHMSLDNARQAATSIGRREATQRATTLRVSVETAQCEEVYAVVVINDCEDWLSRRSDAR